MEWKRPVRLSLETVVIAPGDLFVADTTPAWSMRFSYEVLFSICMLGSEIKGHILVIYAGIH